MDGDDEQELLGLEAELKDLAIRRNKILFNHALANNICVETSGSKQKRSTGRKMDWHVASANGKLGGLCRQAVAWIWGFAYSKFRKCEKLYDLQDTNDGKLPGCPAMIDGLSLSWDTYFGSDYTFEDIERIYDENDITAGNSIIRVVSYHQPVYFQR